MSDDELARAVRAQIAKEIEERDRYKSLVLVIQQRRDDWRDRAEKAEILCERLVEVVRQLRDEHMQAYAGADIALHTVGTAMADRVLKEVQ